MSPYRILALDGGGIRGLITAILLERLQAVYPDLIAKVDLFAGTSTGGILALGFAYGFTPAEARRFYQQSGQAAFADSVLDDIRDIGNLIGADYSIEPLKRLFTERFGNACLKDLRKKVLISAFDLDYDPAQDPRPKARAKDALKVRSWKPKFFHNFPGDDQDGDEKVVDVAIRTSAAPTYFPIYQGYIDGGVVATNPAMCAVAQALHPSTGGQKLEDLVLLSVGTGINPRYLASEDGDWGLLQWAPHIVNLMLEGGAGMVDYQCRQLLGKRYYRLQTILPVAIGMDQADLMPIMEEVAMSVDLTEVVDWLRLYFFAE